MEESVEGTQQSSAGSAAHRRLGRRILGSVMFYTVVGLACGLLATTIFAPELANKIQLDAQISLAEAELKSLQDINHRLGVVSTALKVDPAYAGTVLRREMGYVRPGEERLALPAWPAEKPKDASRDSSWTEAKRTARILEFLCRPMAKWAMLLGSAVLLGGALIFSLPSKECH